MHKHNFGQTLKLQSAVVTVNIRPRSNLIHYFLSPNKSHVSMYVWCRKKPLVQKSELRKGWIYSFFKDDDLEMR